MTLAFQVLFITLLLSACSIAPVESAIPATFTSNATFQNTETSQPTKMPSLPATETLVSEDVIATTGTQEAQLSVEATVATFGTICPAPASAYHAEISPDGRWIAMECEGNDAEVDSYLRVISIHEDKNWLVHYADYAKGTPYDSRNMIRTVHWSSDGKYLYVASNDTGSGCCWIGWDVLLVRLDLENGQPTEIAGFTGNAINFSFSPSERYVLYIPQDGKNNLYIWNTQNSKERIVKLKDTTAGAGYTLMSNDDQKVILVLQDYPKDYQGDVTLGSIVVIDLKSNLQKELLSGMAYEDTPLPVHWQDHDHVLLQKNNEFLLLNINTGELSEAEKP